jgi:acyl dehydratase
MEALARAVPAPAYRDLSLGRHHGPFVERIDEALCRGLEAPRPGRDGNRLAPPGVFPALFLRAHARVHGLVAPGSILARAELEFHGTVRVGAEVGVEVWVGDKYERRGRRYVVIEARVTDPSGRLVVSGRNIVAWPGGTD